MSQLDPSNTTAGDICLAALKESGATGVGQTPLAEDLADAQARLQWMLQQWERKRWMVWVLLDGAVVSTGAQYYSIGPGGDIDTNSNLSPFNFQFNQQFGPAHPVSVRPAKIESAFVRQLAVIGQASQFTLNQSLLDGPDVLGPVSASSLSSGLMVDYPLSIIEAREDYNRIALKSLMAGPGSYLYYDSAWPLGFLFPWPLLQASLYELHVTYRVALPPMWATSSVRINMPYEYYAAMMYNLALRLRPKYGMRTLPGDELKGLARDSLGILQNSNTQISRLHMPSDLVNPQVYNIFSDRMY